MHAVSDHTETEGDGFPWQCCFFPPFTQLDVIAGFSSNIDNLYTQEQKTVGMPPPKKSIFSVKMICSCIPCLYLYVVQNHTQFKRFFFNLQQNVFKVTEFPLLMLRFLSLNYRRRQNPFASLFFSSVLCSLIWLYGQFCHLVVNNEN